jgi:hypothetical protein
MVNQKGQAFSVFELMIAAIVAIAILFVLLPLVVPPDIGGNANDEIGRSLATVEAGGFTRTQEFTLTPGEIVTSADFDDKGFDASQIIFDGGELETATIPKVESSIDDSGDIEFSFVKSVSNTPSKAKAMVYCSATGQLLESTISAAGVETSGGEGSFDASLCTASDAQPCCAVILVRK